MTDKQAIPWARLSAEATAIVLSILVAFAIDAWWDQTQEERRLVATLETLEASFSEHLELVQGNHEIASANRDLLNRFIEMDADDIANISTVDRLRTFRAILQPNTFNLNTTYLLTVLDDGSLNSLSNSELLRSIAKWQSWNDELQERRVVLLENESASLQAAAKRPELWPCLRSVGGDQVASDASDDIMRTLREDQGLMARAVEKRYSVSVHLFYLENLQRQTEEILNLLRAELAG